MMLQERRGALRCMGGQENEESILVFPLTPNINFQHCVTFSLGKGLELVGKLCLLEVIATLSTMMNK